MNGKKGLVVVFVVLVALVALASAAYGVLAPRAQQQARPEASGQSEPADGAGADTDVDAGTGAAGTAGAAGSADSEAGGASDIVLPDFTVTDAEGAEVALSSQYGKPVLMIYWATWCPPCVQESPEVQALYERYGDQVNFMMVNAADRQSESPETVEAWLDERDYTFPVYYDTQGEAQRAGQVYYLPTMFALDPQGNVLATRSGAMDEETGEALLQRLLESA